MIIAPMPNPSETDTMYVSRAADWIADVTGWPLNEVLETIGAEVDYLQQSERAVTEHLVGRLAAVGTADERDRIMEETGTYFA